MKSKRNVASLVIVIGLLFSGCSGSAESAKNKSTGPGSDHEPSCDESAGHLVALVGDSSPIAAEDALAHQEYLLESCELAVWNKALKRCIVESISVEKVRDCMSAAQSFEAGMQVMCSAPVEVKTTDESRRMEMMADYIAHRLLNPEVVDAFSSIGSMDLSERREFLNKLSDRAGISSCPLAAL